MRRRSAILALLAAGALVTAAACGDDDDNDGSSDEVTAAEAETVVRETLETGGFASDEVEDVSCPSGESREQGTRFECDAKVADTDVKVAVEVQETGGRFALQTTQSVFETGAIEERIESEYDERESVAVSAVCSDDKLIEVDDGATFGCTVEDSNGTVQAVTVTAEQGGNASFDTPSFP